MGSEKEWRLPTAGKFLRAVVPRAEPSCPLKKALAAKTMLNPDANEMLRASRFLSIRPLLLQRACVTGVAAAGGYHAFFQIFETESCISKAV